MTKGIVSIIIYNIFMNDAVHVNTSFDTFGAKICQLFKPKSIFIKAL